MDFSGKDGFESMPTGGIVVTGENECCLKAPGLELKVSVSVCMCERTRDYEITTEYTESVHFSSVSSVWADRPDSSRTSDRPTVGRSVLNVWGSLILIYTTFPDRIAPTFPMRTHNTQHRRLGSLMISDRDPLPWRTNRWHNAVTCTHWPTLSL